MNEYKIFPESLYDYTAGVYAGVLVKEKTMKKLAALQTKHLEQVKRVLLEAAEEGEVFPSSWTLHYPDGEQTHVKYINPKEDVRERIRVAILFHQPRYCPLVFIASSRSEAEEMADTRHKEMSVLE